MKQFTITPTAKQFAELRKPKVFTITKKIAKHGRQAIIVIPKLLQNILKPNTIVELQIKVLEEK